MWGVKDNLSENSVVASGSISSVWELGFDYPEKLLPPQDQFSHRDTFHHWSWFLDKRRGKSRANTKSTSFYLRTRCLNAELSWDSQSKLYNFSSPEIYQFCQAGAFNEIVFTSIITGKNVYISLFLWKPLPPMSELKIKNCMNLAPNVSAPTGDRFSLLNISFCY